MFLGSIDDNIRRYLAKIAPALSGRTVYVGCSGNFTSEKVIRQHAEPAAIHSNDVSLYSLLLADAMLGRKTALAVKHDDYRFLERYFEHDNVWMRPAAVMVLLRMLAFRKRKNAYEQRMYDRYMEEFDALVAASADKLEGARTQIDSYYSGDVFDFFQQHEDDEGGVFVSFLPFYSGGYESLFKAFDEVVEWPKPDYPLLDEERRAEIIEWQRQRPHIFILDYRLEDAEEKVVSYINRRRTTYIYSNITEKTALFRRKRNDSGRRFVTVPEGFRFTPETEIGYAPISPADLTHYKELFLSKGIDFAMGTYAVAFLADGYVFGFAEMMRGSYSHSWYLNSDFPTEPKPHKRTSKLVVMLALSNEVRRFLELQNLRRTDGLITTAFTDKPVSMKYRGVLDLIKRGDGYLNYGKDWPGASLQEQYELWLKKYAKKSKTKRSKAKSNA